MKNNKTYIDCNGRMIKACCGISAIIPSSEEKAKVMLEMWHVTKKYGSQFKAMIADENIRCDIIRKDDKGYFYGETRGSVSEKNFWNNMYSYAYWKSHKEDVQTIVNDFLSRNPGGKRQIAAIYAWARACVNKKQAEIEGVRGISFDTTPPVIAPYENAIAMLDGFGDDVTININSGVSKLESANASPEVITNFINGVCSNIANVVNQFNDAIDKDLDTNQAQQVPAAPVCNTPDCSCGNHDASQYAQTANMQAAEKYVNENMAILDGQVQQMHNSGASPEAIANVINSNVAEINRVGELIANGGMNPPQQNMNSNNSINPVAEELKRRGVYGNNQKVSGAAYSKVDEGKKNPLDEFEKMVIKNKAVEFADISKLDLTPVESNAPMYHPNDPQFHNGYMPYVNPTTNLTQEDKTLDEQKDEIFGKGTAQFMREYEAKSNF